MNYILQGELYISSMKWLPLPRHSLFFVAIFFINALFSQPVFRWDVKTLTDSSGIDWMNKLQKANHNKYASIEGLTVKPVQFSNCFSAKKNTRRSDEKRVVKLKIRLIKIKIESNDNDYHIVLQSLTDTSHYMVAEIPDPDDSVYQSSEYAAYRQLFGQLRDQVKSLLGKDPSKSFKRFPGNLIVKIYGVPFWDCQHQGSVNGASVDFREIHPVLQIK